jgi:hypothetical protein
MADSRCTSIRWPPSRSTWPNITDSQTSTCVSVSADSRLMAAQKLLGKLLAALGPITTNTMIEYLQNHPNVLLADVGLLEMIATLLPNLSKRIITILVEVIDTILTGQSDDCE